MCTQAITAGLHMELRLALGAVRAAVDVLHIMGGATLAGAPLGLGVPVSVPSVRKAGQCFSQVTCLRYCLSVCGPLLGLPPKLQPTALRCSCAVSAVVLGASMFQRKPEETRQPEGAAPSTGGIHAMQMLQAQGRNTCTSRRGTSQLYLRAGSCHRAVSNSQDLETPSSWSRPIL